MSLSPLSPTLSRLALLLIASVLLIIASCSSDSPTKPKIPNNEHPEDLTVAYVGSALWSGMSGMEVSGGFAYCICRYGLLVVDATNPYSPVEISRLFLPSPNPRSVTVDGNYVYVVGKDTGLQTVDVTSPYSPHLAGSCSTPGEGCAIAVSGNYAYIADGSARLRIADVSNPQSPSIVASFNAADSTYDVCIDGGYAYLAVGYAGMQVVDITNPRNPKFASLIDTWGDAMALDIEGDVAVVIDGNVNAININDPTTPFITDTIMDYGWGGDVKISDGQVYESSGIVVGIADPYDIRLLSNVYYRVWAGHSVSLEGGHVTSGWDFGVDCLDISDPQNPIQLGRFTSASGTTACVSASGGIAFVSSDGAIQAVSLTDPSMPSAYASTGLLYTPYVMDEQGGIAFVVEFGYNESSHDWEWELETISVADVNNLIAVGSYALPEPPHGYSYHWKRSIAINGESALIADGSLLIIDVADPAAPHLDYRYESYSSGDDRALINSVAASGDFAYCNSGYNLLQIIDVSDPSHPDSTGSYCGVDDMYLSSGLGTDVAGEYAFIPGYKRSGYTNYTYRLFVLDVSVPAAPKYAGGCTIGGYGTSKVVVDGSYAYLLRGSVVDVVNIFSPTSPYKAGSYSSPFGIKDIAVTNGHICLVDGYGLMILDASKL